MAVPSHPTYRSTVLSMRERKSVFEKLFPFASKGLIKILTSVNIKLKPILKSIVSVSQ
jgi:hypothetical protein